jgi:hypothetical protein
VQINPLFATTGPSIPKRYFINVTNVSEEYTSTDTARFRLFIFDQSNPIMKLTKTPIESTSAVLDFVHFSIRDVMSNVIIIPFDRTYNSTKLSSDNLGMYFDVWMSSLIDGRSYAIDVLLVEGSKETIYRNAGPPFRVIKVGA